MSTEIFNDVGIDSHINLDKSLREDFDNSIFRLRDNHKKKLPVGVKPIDEAIGGMAKNDFLLIGARSGAGKTQLAMNIAKNISNEGKRVYFIALEAYVGEITDRILKDKVNDIFHRIPELRERMRRERLSKEDLTKEEILTSDFLADHSNEIQNELNKCRNMYVRYNTDTFSIDDVKREIITAKKEGMDIIILDHIHFVDLPGKNENQELSEVIKAIRRCALASEIPIILIAHLRKGDKQSKSIVPEIEDFQGTSNLFKIPTKAILLAPALEHMREGEGIVPTFIRIAKNRIDGSRTRYTLLANYDLKLSTYQDQYQLGYVNGKNEFKQAEEIPNWALSAKTNFEPIEKEGDKRVYWWD